MIKVDFIEDIDDKDESFQKQLDCLLEAIINWDEISVFLDDYLKSVKKFLKGSLERNKCDIEDILKRKNPARVAWKMESVSVLIDLLDDDEQLLGDVLENIKVRIMKN